MKIKRINFMGSANMVLRVKFIDLNAYMRKEDRKINDLRIYIKKLAKRAK